MPQKCLNPEKGCQHTADLNGKHHYVVIQRPWVEFDERIDNRTPIEFILICCQDFGP